jgi:[ribosomal protein S18]-alanine N-acetyltransferase
MCFKSQKMDRMIALEILKWKYEPPYDFYNNEITEEALMELLEKPYQAVLDDKGVLIGFYCYGEAAQIPAGRLTGAYSDPAIDVGIGMDPAITGKRNGRSFFSFVLAELESLFPDMTVRLTVADFNKRAIKLYENVGFIKEMKITSGAIDFITMVKN